MPGTILSPTRVHPRRGLTPVDWQWKYLKILDQMMDSENTWPDDGQWKYSTSWWTVVKTPAVGKERGRFDAPEISVALNFKLRKTKMERSKEKSWIYDGIFLAPIFGWNKSLRYVIWPKKQAWLTLGRIGNPSRMERYSWKRNPKRIFEQNITLQSVTQNSNSDF